MRLNRCRSVGICRYMPRVVAQGHASDPGNSMTVSLSLSLFPSHSGAWLYLSTGDLGGLSRIDKRASHPRCLNTLHSSATSTSTFHPVFLNFLVSFVQAFDIISSVCWNNPKSSLNSLFACHKLPTSNDPWSHNFLAYTKSPLSDLGNHLYLRHSQRHFSPLAEHLKMGRGGYN